MGWGILKTQPKTLTNFKRQMFSRSAPIQPQNPNRNMITPTMINNTAGSKSHPPNKPSESFS